jgi:DNA invertase Pin-like site-specific DNA recombinase
MRQVITYLRFSSKPQERGDSIRRQKGLFERWLKDNPDAKVVDEFSDEGASAYHGHHLKGDFGRMLQNIQDGTSRHLARLLIMKPVLTDRKHVIPKTL